MFQPVPEVRELVVWNACTAQQPQRHSRGNSLMTIEARATSRSGCLDGELPAYLTRLKSLNPTITKSGAGALLFCNNNINTRQTTGKTLARILSPPHHALLSPDPNSSIWAPLRDNRHFCIPRRGTWCSTSSHDAKIQPKLILIDRIAIPATRRVWGPTLLTFQADRAGDVHRLSLGMLRRKEVD